MTFPLTDCTDIFLIVLSYLQPLEAVGIMMQTSKSTRLIVRGDSVLWRALCNQISCPICMEELISLHVICGTVDSSFWIESCKMLAACRRIRSQWRTNLAVRSFKVESLERAQMPRAVPEPVSVNEARNHSLSMVDARRACAPKIGTIPKKVTLYRKITKSIATLADLFSVSSGGSGTISAFVNIPSPDPFLDLQVSSKSEIQTILNRFLVLEGGVLLTPTCDCPHRHDLGQAKHPSKYYSKKVNFVPRLSHFRQTMWKEICATPGNNFQKLPVISAFVGYPSGLKYDQRCLISLMYAAVGGGGRTASAVRWFYSRVLPLTGDGSLEYKEVLVAICFSHEVQISNTAGSSTLYTLQSSPSAARVVGVHCQSSAQSWLS